MLPNSLPQPLPHSLPRLRLKPPQRGSAASRVALSFLRPVATLLLFLLLLLLAAKQLADGGQGSGGGGNGSAAPRDLGTALGGHQRGKLVLYAYLNSTLEDISSLQFFIQHALLQDDSCDYLLLLPVGRGRRC
jgi:hypothetical protein